MSTDKPVKLISTTEKISVEMPEILDNGGSTILMYELQADDGLQSDLEIIYLGLNRTVDLSTI
jgi:hypothetical protein